MSNLDISLHDVLYSGLAFLVSILGLAIRSYMNIVKELQILQAAKMDSSDAAKLISDKEVALSKMDAITSDRIDRLEERLDRMEENLGNKIDVIYQVLISQKER